MTQDAQTGLLEPCDHQNRPIGSDDRAVLVITKFYKARFSAEIPQTVVNMDWFSRPWALLPTISSVSLCRPLKCILVVWKTTFSRSSTLIFVNLVHNLVHEYGVVGSKRTKVRNQTKIDVAMQAVKPACLLYECDILFRNMLYNNKCVVSYC